MFQPLHWVKTTQKTQEHYIRLFEDASCIAQAIVTKIHHIGFKRFQPLASWPHLGPEELHPSLTWPVFFGALKAQLRLTYS